MTSISLKNVSLSFNSKVPPRNKGARDTAQQTDSNLPISGNLTRQKGSSNVRVHAIDNISLELKEGDRLGVVGVNGAGKTTLLRVMAGIYPPTQGEVETVGRITTLFSVGLGMQPDTSGFKNIFLSGYIQGLSKSEIEEHVDDILSFTELGEYINLPMKVYSQGMAMRLRFACATAFQPDIVIMDEWIGAGDTEFQEKAQQRLTKLLEDTGIVVLASHNQALMRRMATKLIWMESGHIRAFGDVNEVLQLKDEDFHRRKALSAKNQQQ